MLLLRKLDRSPLDQKLHSAINTARRSGCGRILPEAAYWASLSYLNTRDDPENLKIVDPYYRSVLNKLTYEQKLQLVERLERQVRQD